MDPALIIAAASSAAGMYILQQIVSFIRRSWKGTASWVRREVDKAEKAKREAEAAAERERARRVAAEEEAEGLRDDNERLRKSEETAHREKRVANERMHRHRLIIMEVAPDRLPALQEETP